MISGMPSRSRKQSPELAPDVEIGRIRFPSPLATIEAVMRALESAHRCHLYLSDETDEWIVFRVSELRQHAVRANESPFRVSSSDPLQL